MTAAGHCGVKEPGGAAPGAGAEALAELLAIVARLRGPDGCPWDREQTLESLKPCLIEETYELIDAIATGDVMHHREELGDVLLQVVMQSQIRAEAGAFNFADVCRAISAKLVERHPHVFGDAQAATAADVVRQWERIKAGRKAGGSSVLDGLPRHLPALVYAQRMQARAARCGFDWDDAGQVLAKVREEVDELAAAMAGEARAAEVEEELGDLLFAVVNLARWRKAQAESLLDAANRKFARRFRAVEDTVRGQGRALRDCTLTELDAIWEAVKRQEKETIGKEE